MADHRLSVQIGQNLVYAAHAAGLARRDDDRRARSVLPFPLVPLTEKYEFGALVLTPYAPSGIVPLAATLPFTYTVQTLFTPSAPNTIAILFQVYGLISDTEATFDALTDIFELPVPA